MPEKAFKDLHSILNMIIRDYGLKDRVSKERIFQNWSSIMGEKIANICRPVSYHEGELTIKARDKFWRDELAHRRQDLLNLLDKRIERSLVKKINII